MNRFIERLNARTKVEGLTPPADIEDLIDQINGLAKASTPLPYAEIVSRLLSNPQDFSFPTSKKRSLNLGGQEKFLLERRLAGLSLEQIGTEMGLTRDKTTKIEAGIFNKIRKLTQNHSGEF